MNIVVAGATGFIGRALLDALAARGDRLTVLTRSKAAAAAKAPEGAVVKEWDGKHPGPWHESLDGADAVINLAGEGVADALWTASRKIALIKSRVDSTRALVEAIGKARRKPKALVNASAVGYYGDAGDAPCLEDAPAGQGFLAALCAQWEREALAAEKHGARVALARIGVVLEEDGGALARMLTPFKLCVGGPLGSGKQWFPWIHRADAVGALIHMVDSASVRGPVNLAAPGAATNAEFTKALGRALGRPAFLPAPAFALRLILGDMAEILLASQKVQPKALLDSGYAFKHPQLDGALRDILA